jgi:hypothetical protein
MSREPPRGARKEVMERVEEIRKRNAMARRSERGM